MRYEFHYGENSGDLADAGPRFRASTGERMSHRSGRGSKAHHPGNGLAWGIAALPAKQTFVVRYSESGSQFVAQ